MATELSNMSRHDLEAKIIKHSWDDEAFRKEFIADPAAAFTKYLELPAASLPKIVVHEEEHGTWHIVLPTKPAASKELSEEDLEKIAGGATPTIIIVSEITALTISATKAVTDSECGW